MCCVEPALDNLLCTHLGSKGFLRRGSTPFNNPTALPILEDPGADSGGEGKSERAERTARRAPGDNVLPDQFQTVAAGLPSNWAEKHKSFLAPIRSQKGGDRLELVR